MNGNRKPRPTHDSRGLFPAFHDLYHGLTVVMQDSERESLDWSLHPWMDEIGVPEGDWDCDFSTQCPASCREWRHGQHSTVGGFARRTLLAALRHSARWPPHASFEAFVP
jgi:hypothetical protein